MAYEALRVGEIKTKKENIESCLKTSRATENLWSTVERIERFGLIISWAIIILGVINAIFSAYQVEEVVKGVGLYSRTEEVRTFSYAILIGELFYTILYAGFFKAICFFVSTLIGGLANISGTNDVIANLNTNIAARLEDVEKKIQKEQNESNV